MTDHPQRELSRTALRRSAAPAPCLCPQWLARRSPCSFGYQALDAIQRFGTSLARGELPPVDVEVALTCLGNHVIRRPAIVYVSAIARGDLGLVVDFAAFFRRHPVHEELGSIGMGRFVDHGNQSEAGAYCTCRLGKIAYDDDGKSVLFQRLKLRCAQP